MKSTFRYSWVLPVIFLLSNVTYGQWVYSGSNIYYNSGNVGIGTPANLSLGTFVITSTASDNIAWFGGKNGCMVVVNNESGYAELVGRTGGNTGYQSLDFRTSATPGQLFLASNGNVGIGTTSPTEGLLQLFGTEGNSVVLYSNSASHDYGLGINNNNLNAFFPSNAHFSIRRDNYNGAEEASIDYSGNGYFAGNVLIQKTSQTNTAYHLDVAGGIRADSVVVNSTGADFVFDENYQKLSLDELGQYVSAHRHLPGVASSEDVQKDGVSVGALQTKLLQKVEELTLYVIDQNKRIEKLEKENAELRSNK
ncbi:MAG: hypothetical protein WAO19_04030 [Candidatus Kryptoniota bacterium]